MFHGAVAARFRLTATDLKTLDILQRQGTRSAGELAAHTGLATPSVTALIDRLEAKGLIRRVRGPRSAARDGRADPGAGEGGRPAVRPVEPADAPPLRAVQRPRDRADPRLPAPRRRRDARGDRHPGAQLASTYGAARTGGSGASIRAGTQFATKAAATGQKSSQR